MRLLSLSLLATAAIAVAAAPAAQAATFCVGTVNDLRDALSTAGSNGEADTIRVRSGTYQPTDGNVGFSYSGESQGLTISGGWITIGMVSCVLQNNAQGATILDGDDSRRVMQVSMPPGTAPITLSRLTFRSGSSLEGGAGLRVGGSAGYAGDVTLEHLVFDGNVSTQAGGGLSGGSDGGIVNIRNSLFIANQGSVHGAASLTINATSTSTTRFFFGHNTVVANSCGTGDCTGGVRFGGSARGVFYNNAFAFNESADFLLNSLVASLAYNQYQERAGQNPAAESGSLMLANPGFVNALGSDFHLADDSPLRDHGTGAFNEGGTDLDGEPRLNGPGYDVGAYETQSYVFADGFEVIL